MKSNWISGPSRLRFPTHWTCVRVEKTLTLSGREMGVCRCVMVGRGGCCKSEGYITLPWLTNRKLIMERTEMKERRAETTTMRAMLVGTFYYLHVNGVRAEKVMPLVIKHQVSSYLPSLSSWSHKFLNSPSTLFLYMALSTDQCLERWAWNMYRNDSTAYTLVIGEHCDSATFLISLSWLSILTEWKPTCQTFLFHHLIFLSFHSIFPILKGKGKSFPIPPPTVQDQTGDPVRWQC